MKTTNYKKEAYRGSLKQYMKVRGLRTISLENYNKWLDRKNDTGVHSLKLDLQDGYVNIYGYTNKGRCGGVINDASSELYGEIFEQVTDIFANEKEMPLSVRRNVLVKINR